MKVSFRTSIPKKYHEELYALHMDGLTVNQIRQHYKTTAQCNFTNSCVNALIAKFDLLYMKPALQALVSGSVNSTFESLDVLEYELKLKLLDAKNNDDTRNFYKAVDRLLKIYQTKLMSNAFNKQIDAIVDNGKEEFLESLKKLALESK